MINSKSKYYQIPNSKPLEFGNWDLFGSIGIIGIYLVVLVLLVVLGFWIISLWATAYADVATSFWNIKKSEHFIVYYKAAPIPYIGEVVSKAEAYYDTITEDLGFRRYDGFWTWDERAKIYLYDTRQEYTNQTGRVEWAAAHVDVLRREVYSYVNMENFLEIILPHELGHIVFREFIGFDKKLPLWLDEGVVCYLERDRRANRLAQAKAIFNTIAFRSLGELGRRQIDLNISAEVFYAEAASVIEFLVSVYGKDRFYQLCQRLRDLRGDQNWFTAFQAVYRFGDIDAMNEKWVAFLKDEG